MTDTAVTVTTLAPGTGIAAAAGTAITAANTHTITPPAGATLDEIILVIKNTTASTKVATVTAGTKGIAPHATATALPGLADGSSVPTYGVVALSSAEHGQKSGAAVVTVASGMTGTIAAYWLKRQS